MDLAIRGIAARWTDVHVDEPSKQVVALRPFWLRVCHRGERGRPTRQVDHAKSMTAKARRVVGSSAQQATDADAADDVQIASGEGEINRNDRRAQAMAQSRASAGRPARRRPRR